MTAARFIKPTKIKTSDQMNHANSTKNPDLKNSDQIQPATKFFNIQKIKVKKIKIQSCIVFPIALNKN